MSSNFESWITRLKVSWMGKNAQRIFGGFAAALGDKSYDWALQGVLEHLPGSASTPSNQLTSSERQLEIALGELNSSMAARLPYASKIHRFDGSPLRMLLGLHFAGLDGAYVVQQNGRAYSLTLPLPDFSDTWDPTGNLVTANTATTIAPLSSPTKGKSPIPSGTPWFQLDANPDLTNRFKVIFPTWPFSAITQAVFNNSDSAAVTWPVPFASSSYSVIYGVSTDSVTLSVDNTTQTTTGVTLRASGAWTGSVWVIGFASGVNPFNTFSSESVGLMQKVITLTRPEKSYCTGVYWLTSGRFWGWPTTVKWGDGGTWGGSVQTILGAF